MKNKLQSILWITLFGFLLPYQGYSFSEKNPKLVVLIVIDQFRYDYLTRFSEQFTGGFRRILDKGAFYTNANYDYACTVTSSGHACISTGSSPNRNGIIGNFWFDRTSKRLVYSCEDSTAPLWTRIVLAQKENRSLTSFELEEGRSPNNLNVLTIGDALKLATNNKSKVFSISQKDRSAIFLGGHKSNGTYWMDRQTAEYTSSAYYGTTPPSWLVEFNEKYPASQYFGKEWNRLLPEKNYTLSRPDDDLYENNPERLGITFPHSILGANHKIDSSFIEAFLTTPLANEQLFKLAECLIQQEKLGRNTVPDLLCMSLSSNDLGGHAFGPNSQEMQDFTLWTDEQLGRFFNYLDKTVGLKNTLIFVTADHGVCPLPEILQESKIDAGRLSPETVLKTVRQKLKESYGREDLVEGFSTPCIYLNHGAIVQAGLSLSDVQSTTLRALENIPQIAGTYTQQDLLSGHYPLDDIAQYFARSCYPKHSGDIFINLKPFWTFGNPRSKGTDHGTPYPYNTHVPILVYGYQTPQGHFTRQVVIEDIAPTIAQILGVELSTNSYKTVLSEVIH